MIYSFLQRRKSRTSRNREAGQALALAAVSLTVLLLAAGLAIDMGFLRYQRRRIQSAADSAAIAGAGEVNYGDVGTAAQDDAALNGFTNGGSGNTQVNVACSATESGGFGGCDAGTPYVQVSVSQQEPLFFMKIIPGITPPTVSAQAVGYLGNGPNCMYALLANNTSISGSTNGATTTVNAKCAILSNGSINITACLDHFIASSIGYIGTSAISPCEVEPSNPQQIAIQAANPLVNLAAPGAPGTCITPTVISNQMYPGNYPCGIQITGNGLMVNFMPGTYVLAGGMTIQGSNDTITGNGVTFYNANGQILICASPTGTITPGTGCLNNTGDSITLTAPTSGPYAGILFYQDAGDPLPAVILGNDAYGTTFTTYLEGVFYFPSAQLTLAELTDGSNWQSSYDAIVANSITLIGTVQFGNGSVYLPTLANGSPIKDAVLVQ